MGFLGTKRAEALGIKNDPWFVNGDECAVQNDAVYKGNIMGDHCADFSGRVAKICGDLIVAEFVGPRRCVAAPSYEIIEKLFIFRKNIINSIMICCKNIIEIVKLFYGVV